MGLFRSRQSYEPTQIDERLAQSADAVPGQLLQIIPFKENEGITGGAQLLKDLHTVEWGGMRNTTNVSDHHAFELWFNEGSVSFYLHTGSKSPPDKYISRIENRYSNSDVQPISAGTGFPTIEPGEYVAAAEIDLEQHHFYTLRHFQEEGFEDDPYSGIINEMLSTEETRVVVQVVMRPEPTDWADDDGGGFLRRGVSVNDIAESLREENLVGFLNPRTRPPSTKEKEAANIIERQRGQCAFNVNLRVLAISPEPAEARARCEGVAEMFEQAYNSKTGQGFEASPVDPGHVRQVVADCHQRAWYDNETILTYAEVVGAAHVPKADIETPNIAWKNTQRGSRVSPDAAQDK